MTYQISPRLVRFTKFSEDRLSDKQKEYLDGVDNLEVADFDDKGTIVLVPPDWNDQNTPSPMPIRVTRDGKIV